MSRPPLVDFVGFGTGERSSEERERIGRQLVEALQAQPCTPPRERSIQADHSFPRLAPSRSRTSRTGLHLHSAESDRCQGTRRDPTLPIGAVVIPIAGSLFLQWPRRRSRLRPTLATPIRLSEPGVPMNLSKPGRRAEVSPGRVHEALRPSSGELPVAHRIHIRAVSDSLTSTGRPAPAESHQSLAR